MTLEEIAGDLVSTTTGAALDEKRRLFVAALRQVRNEALEEAKKAAEGEMEHTPDDSWYHAAETIAEQIETLKHKDGQP